MSDGLARLLEGWWVLTHDGTIQAIWWLSDTRARLAVSQAQTLTFIPFHNVIGHTEWKVNTADNAVLNVYSYVLKAAEFNGALFEG